MAKAQIVKKVGWWISLERVGRDERGGLVLEFMFAFSGGSEPAEWEIASLQRCKQRKDQSDGQLDELIFIFQGSALDPAKADCLDWFKDNKP